MDPRKLPKSEMLPSLRLRSASDTVSTCGIVEARLSSRSLGKTGNVLIAIRGPSSGIFGILRLHPRKCSYTPIPGLSPRKEGTGTKEPIPKDRPKKRQS